MSKIRVYELAKMLGKSNNEITDILKGLGVEVKATMSSIDPQIAQKVEEIVKAMGAKPESAGEKQLSALIVPEDATIKDAAKALGLAPGAVVKALIEKGFMAPASAPLDAKISEALGKIYGKQFVKGDVSYEDEPTGEIQDDMEYETEDEMESQTKGGTKKGRDVTEHAKDKKEKPSAHKAVKKGALPHTKPHAKAANVLRYPIVTVMGHVDHGKTTLLDFIRKTKVTEKEAGGITQHIGASSVNYNGNKIIFLDTPGHAAFTAMRARGAQVTDIAILVVAADDGVMPQTLEALHHAKAANVPIIVAINKVDKPDAKPDRVRQQLSDHGLAPEEWGGNTVMVEVAAKTGIGVDDLLDMVLLVAEMEELKADPNAEPQGTVVEANLDRGKGPVATVIVQQGTLKRGQIIRTDSTWGKIRAMIDASGRYIDSAGPSTPVEILGLESVPVPGEMFTRADDEREARGLHSQQEQIRKEQESKKSHRMTLDQLYEKLQEGDIPQLNLVLKCDVQGSLEAVHSSLLKMATPEVGINIVHGGVGRVSESDVMLASASNAIILGFNVRPDANAKKISENEAVEIRTYHVIYDLQDDVRAALEGLLEPTIRENIQGQIEIRAVFKVPKAGKVAGCYVMEGLIKRNSRVRLIREGVVIWEGGLSALRRFKDDVKEVTVGYECGLSFTNFQDFKEGDIIEDYELLKEKKFL